jgi:tetratricopeptide (TPR) repeat protein
MHTKIELVKDDITKGWFYMKKLAVIFMLIPTLVFAETKQENPFDADAFIQTVSRHTDVKEQESLIKQELEKYPQEIKLYLFLGAIYSNWAKGDPSKYIDAENSYKKALQIESGSLGAKNGLGSVYFSTDQYNRAEKEFNEIMLLDSNYAPVYVNYGLLKAHKGQYEEAITYFEKAISLDPIVDEIDFVHLYLGDCYGWLKLEDKAIAEYEKTCDINPQYIQPHLNLGSLYGTKALKNNDLSYIDKAKNHFNAVLKLMPDNQEARTGLKMIQQASEKIKSNNNLTIKSSGDAIIVFPKQYERQAEGLKIELDKNKKKIDIGGGSESASP